MRDPIYYPTFEVENPNWLKFALLYFEHLKPIIPDSAHPHLSQQYQMLLNESDFLKPYVPEYPDSIGPSLDAIGEIERILKAPDRYTDLFGENDFLDRWRHPSGQTRSLFEEKFSGAFLDFVTREGLARRDRNGVTISRDLADLYMSIFAHALSESVGNPPITDLSMMDRYGCFVRKSSPEENITNSIAQSVISIAIPENLEELTLESILALRSRPEFSEKQRAFRSAVKRYHDELEEGKADHDFFEAQGGLIKDISSDIAAVGSGAVSLVFSTWIALSVDNLGVKELYGAGLGAVAFGIPAIVDIRNSWQSSANRRLTRKYLADLKTIGA